MDKKDIPFIMYMKKQFVLPHTALKLRDAGFPQGYTPYLWHLDAKKEWVLYKRNSKDISSFGDKYLYKRWVSAPMLGQVKDWAEHMKEAKQSREELFAILEIIFSYLKQEGTEDDG